jgi:hypothetical protein
MSAGITGVHTIPGLIKIMNDFSIFLTVDVLAFLLNAFKNLGV